MSQRPSSKIPDIDLTSRILPLMNKRIPEEQLILEAVQHGATEDQARHLVFQLYVNGALKLLDDETPNDEVKTRLSTLGASPQTVGLALKAAQSLLILKADEERQRKEKGRSQLIWGLIILSLGLAVTWASISAAGPGGTYIITTGAIVVGGWKLLQGLSNLR